MTFISLRLEETDGSGSDLPQVGEIVGRLEERQFASVQDLALFMTNYIKSRKCGPSLLLFYFWSSVLTCGAVASWTFFLALSQFFFVFLPVTLRLLLLLPFACLSFCSSGTLLSGRARCPSRTPVPGGSSCRCLTTARKQAGWERSEEREILGRVESSERERERESTRRRRVSP